MSEKPASTHKNYEILGIKIGASKTEIYEAFALKASEFKYGDRVGLLLSEEQKKKLERGYFAIFDAAKGLLGHDIDKQLAEAILDSHYKVLFQRNLVLDTDSMPIGYSNLEAFDLVYDLDYRVHYNAALNEISYGSKVEEILMRGQKKELESIYVRLEEGLIEYMSLEPADKKHSYRISIGSNDTQVCTDLKLTDNTDYSFEELKLKFNSLTSSFEIGKYAAAILDNTQRGELIDRIQNASRFLKDLTGEQFDYWHIYLSELTQESPKAFDKNELESELLAILDFDVHKEVKLMRAAEVYQSYLSKCKARESIRSSISDGQLKVLDWLTIEIENVYTEFLSSSGLYLKQDSEKPLGEYKEEFYNSRLSELIGICSEISKKEDLKFLSKFLSDYRDMVLENKVELTPEVLMTASVLPDEFYLHNEATLDLIFHKWLKEMSVNDIEDMLKNVQIEMNSESFTSSFPETSIKKIEGLVFVTGFFIEGNYGHYAELLRIQSILSNESELDKYLLELEKMNLEEENSQFNALIQVNALTKNKYGISIRAMSTLNKLSNIFPDKFDKETLRQIMRKLDIDFLQVD